VTGFIQKRLSLKSGVRSKKKREERNTGQSCTRADRKLTQSLLATKPK